MVSSPITHATSSTTLALLWAEAFGAIAPKSERRVTTEITEVITLLFITTYFLLAFFFAHASRRPTV